MRDAQQDRKQKRHLLQSLLSQYFNLKRDDGQMALVDDPQRPLKGADWKKIVNYLVPPKNKHPKARPAGFAAVVDVLRDNNILDLSLFPNDNLVPVFALFGKKPTAYSNRVRAITQSLQTSRLIAQSVSHGQESDWEPFS